MKKEKAVFNKKITFEQVVKAIHNNEFEVISQVSKRMPLMFAIALQLFTKAPKETLILSKIFGDKISFLRMNKLAEICYGLREEK